MCQGTGKAIHIRKMELVLTALLSTTNHSLGLSRLSIQIIFQPAYVSISKIIYNVEEKCSYGKL